jgi:hypothetical protein
MASAAAAGISAATSILGGITGGKGAKKAADIQAASYQKGIDEEHRQFDATRADFAPYRDAGLPALASIQDLLGQNGDDVQLKAIAGLKASPGFTSLFNTGSDTILQNGAATGGLRGGNIQHSLADFGSNLLATVIQGQLGNLGGLVNTGVGAANSIGQFGQQTADNVAGLLGKQGGALGTAAAAPYAAFSGIMNQLGGNSQGIAKALGW